MSDPSPPQDVTPPTLTQVWQTGPEMDGFLNNPESRYPGTGPVIPPDTNLSGQFTVTPGTIHEAISTILQDSQNVVDNYDALKDYITSVKSWIFTVHDADALYEMPPPEARGSGYGPQIPRKVQWPHDPHPQWTQEFTAYSDMLLLQIADAVETAGQFVSTLNAAGQIYTKTDKTSFLPPFHTQGKARD